MEGRNGSQRILGITPLINSVSAGLVHVVGLDAGLLSGLDHDLLPLGAISQVLVLRARWIYFFQCLYNGGYIGLSVVQWFSIGWSRAVSVGAK